jgi:hypothetical protein
LRLLPMDKGVTIEEKNDDPVDFAWFSFAE